MQKLLTATTWLVLLGVMAFASACDEDETGLAPLDSPDITGRALVEDYGRLVMAQDHDGLERFLSDAFIVMRADGTSASRQDYLSKLPVVRSFEVQDVTGTQDGSTLVVRWAIKIDEDIEGHTVTATSAQRLSTFAWDAAAGRWRLAAYANFDALATPVAPSPTPTR